MVSEVDCFQSLNLLAHAQMDELETGSECGGHGKCGKDRVRILIEDQKKLNSPTFAELRLLSPVQIAEGWRLACQAFPNENDLSIRVNLNAG